MTDEISCTEQMFIEKQLCSWHCKSPRPPRLADFRRPAEGYYRVQGSETAHVFNKNKLLANSDTVSQGVPLTSNSLVPAVSPPTECKLLEGRQHILLILDIILTGTGCADFIHE